MMVSTIASTLMPLAWIITERTMSRRMYGFDLRILYGEDALFSTVL